MKTKIYQPEEALTAIDSLLCGVWDCPELCKIGELHVETELSIRRILEATER